MSKGSGIAVTGRCLCEAVRYHAIAQTRHIDACHCSMCRRWSAGPFFALNCGSNVYVEDESSLGVYRSSEWAERCFCKVCGTSLFYRMIDKSFQAVSTETLDDKTGFDFTIEVFIDEKPDYYAFANATKKITGAEVMAAFSGQKD